eukprot:COSAG05_NODE_16328_length_348_cov_1.040161_1_plen_42_part_10
MHGVYLIVRVRDSVCVCVVVVTDAILCCGFGWIECECVACAT